jgi:peptide chain release factor subunit 1
LKPVRERLKGREQRHEREALKKEEERVQQWLSSEPPQRRSVAVFSCKPRDLWETHFFAVPVRDHLAYEPKPHLAPLLEILDEYERYAVAVVDKRNARILSIFLGEIEDRQDLKDFVPGKHDQGGWSQARYQRHHEAHVDRHLRRVVDWLIDLYRRRGFDRLILLGPEEPVSALKPLLPEDLASRTAATVSAETSIADAQVLELIRDVQTDVERGAEERLVNEVLDYAAAGGRGAAGIGPVLDAIILGDVQRLLVAEGTQVSGGECPKCGLLQNGSVSACPSCGNELDRVSDLVERMIQRTLDQDGSVEIVHGAPAERLRAKAEGAAALLRFPIPTPEAAAAQR